MPAETSAGNWTKFQISLAVLMLITGSLNTLAAKWADLSSAPYSDGTVQPFSHPFFQAVFMFIGEFLCLIAFYGLRVYHRVRGLPQQAASQSFSPFIFLIPALCDMLGTSTMFVGLTLTFASSFQMLRGAVIVFTALLSVAFLGRIIKRYMWIGIVFVILGLILVGLSDVLFHNVDTTGDINSIISGDLLIIMAQIIIATQMVYEEKVLTRYNVPALQAVGFEGMFGMTILGLMLIPMYYIRVPPPFTADPEHRLENALEAFVQMGHNWQIVFAMIGLILSIALFNFSGISVTKELSATTRMVLDSCRTVFIWAFSLAVGWQVFKPSSFLLQAAGFVLLITGMCLYNNIVCLPLLRKYNIVGSEQEMPSPLADDFEPKLEEDDEHRPLLSDPRGSQLGSVNA